jgi:cell division protein FtsQ
VRPLAEDSYCYEDLRAGNSQGGNASGLRTPRPPRPPRHPAQGSWLAQADAIADKAASVGFVASMIFLAAAAIYAFSLSKAAKPFFAEAFAIVDEAAYNAGFKFEDMALSGFKETPEAEMVAALQIPAKGSSLFYGAKDAQSRLLGIGWIDTAEVRRVLPSRLEVTVTERTPFARFEDNQHKLQVIDREGHILGADETGRFASLPLFAGDGAPREAAAFVDAIDGHGALKDRLQRIEYVAERFWTVKLDSGPSLKLPHKVSPLVLERLDSLLANPKVAGLGLETIDLRLSNRTILQLLDPTVANRDKAIAALSPSTAQAMNPPKKGKAL